MRVLVVDDQLEYSRLVARWLRKLGCAVRIELAASADEALSVMESLTPDLIITDLRMPGMDGFELTRKIKQRAPAPVVIVMTSLEPPQFHERASAAGADYCVEKGNLQNRLPEFLRQRFGVGATAASGKPQENASR
jgi:two-component system, NtrC family, response regulator PilR